MNKNSLKVFISSAQENEDGFNWIDFRKRIKDYLNKCDYLEPFIIEETASSSKSSQFMLRQVESSDLVIQLIKKEVRQGTKNEFSHAIKTKKPMLVYFLKDDSPAQSVYDYKKNIEHEDLCTYKKISDFNNIEEEILNDIIFDVICNYKEIPLRREVDDNDVSVIEVVEYNNYLLNKNSLTVFSSCYDAIYEILGLWNFKDDKEKSVLHDLGIKILKWFVTGKFDLKKDDINEIINCNKDIFEANDWLVKRWNAIYYRYSGMIDDALSAESEALKLAKESNLPQWLINNILIDGRNLENIQMNINHKYHYGEFQKELDSLSEMINFPILDRYKSNVNDIVYKDELKKDLFSPYTIQIGSNFQSAIKYVENYLFVSLFYGSFTHFSLSRELLNTVLYQYGKKRNDGIILVECLKLYIINGDGSNLKKFLIKYWDKMYYIISSDADELFNLTDNTVFENKDVIIQIIIENLGLYLSDEVFLRAEEYIVNYEDKAYSKKNDQYLDAILANVHRFSQEKIVKIISDFIQKKCYSSANKLCQILMRVDYNEVHKETQYYLKIVIKENISDILKNNGTPQIIAALVDHNKEMFQELENIPGNGLEGINKYLYDINLGLNEWLPVLREEIKEARNQFEENKNEGVFFEFALNPYILISEIIRKHKDESDIINTLLNEFMPLAVDILNSRASVITKDQCAECLCDVLSAFNQLNIEIPQNIVEAVENIDINDESDELSVRNSSILSIHILMIKLLVGLSKMDDLLYWCFGYSKMKDKEKIALIVCIEKYLFKMRNNHSDTSLLASIIFQCASDESSEVRRIASKCLAYIINGSYTDKVSELLCSLSIDSSHGVRSSIFALCRDGYIKGDLKAQIMMNLKNDANYNIRIASNNFISG